MYEGTDIEMVYASYPNEDPKWAVGVVDRVAGERFGWYADCGIVYEGDINDGH